MDNIDKLIGKRISEARVSRCFTQEELAERCCISISALSRIETGCNSTSIKTLMSIGDSLGVGLDYILYDLFPSQDISILSPEMQEILFLLKPLAKHDLSFIQKFLELYLSK